MVIKLNKLKEIRTNRKYSYQYMAEKLNISKPFYWQIENNQRRLTYDMAVKIADIFNTTPDDIFYDDIKNNKMKDTSL